MRLLSMFNQEKPVLLGDLRMVLDTLKQKLFEPMFLLAFASGRLASEIHVLDFKSIKLLKKDGQDFLTLSPLVGFMARN